MNTQTPLPLDFSGMSITSDEPNLFMWPLTSLHPNSIARVVYSPARSCYWVEYITRVGQHGTIDAATEESPAHSPAFALADAQALANQYTGFRADMDQFTADPDNNWVPDPASIGQSLAREEAYDEDPDTWTPDRAYAAGYAHASGYQD